MFQLPEVLRALVRLRGFDRARSAARKVIAELLRGRAGDGGFGYEREPLYTLCAATAPVAIALLEARAAGFAVPEDVVEDALDYLQACQGEGGGFRYCPDPRHPLLAKDRDRYLREEVGRTFGALLALHRGGRTGDAFRRGLAFLAGERTSDSIAPDAKYVWIDLMHGSELRAVMDQPTRERFDAAEAAVRGRLARADGSFAWPGMQWAAMLGTPSMHTVLAAAAGTLVMTRRPVTPR
jgi:hypothetical protein